MNTQRSLIVFIGPPGAGKGTLSQRLVDRMGCKQLSTGNLFRKHIQEQTDLGKNIDLAIKSGKLVSDDCVIAMVVEWLSSHEHCGEPVILDGFPRTRAQAEALDAALMAMGAHSFLVTILLMELADEEATRRILGRLVCSKHDCQAVYSISDELHKMASCMRCEGALIRRSDDAPESIVDRLSIYRRHEYEIIDFYKTRNAYIVPIAMNRDPEAIYSEVQQRLANI